MFVARPFAFQSTAGALMFCVMFGAAVGIAVGRRWRPKIVHEVRIQNREIEKTQFKEYFDTYEGRMLLLNVARVDERFRDALYAIVQSIAKAKEDAKL